MPVDTSMHDDERHEAHRDAQHGAAQVACRPALSAEHAPAQEEHEPRPHDRRQHSRGEQEARVRATGKSRVVRHEDHRAAVLLHQPEEHLLHAAGVALVQVSGGLVGEEERRLVDQGARHGHPLALAAGELQGPGVHPSLQPDLDQELPGAFPQHAGGLARPSCPG